MEAAVRQAPSDEHDRDVPTFSDWVAARAHVLQRFAYLVRGDAADADDAFHQALVSAYQHWDDIAQTGDAEIYTKRMLVEARTPWWRQRRRRNSDSEPKAGWSPTAGLSERPPEDVQRMWRLCAELTPAQRALVVLRYDEDMDEADIGDILDCSADVVRSQLRHTIGALRSAWERGRTTMRDVEGLLRETFDRYAAGAPEAVDPAQRAIAACRRGRRRQTVGGLLVAVGLLVPVAWLVQPETDAPAPSAPAPGVPLSEVPEWRWESYGGVEVEVPATWGHGDLTQWCAAAGEPGHIAGPAVDRPVIEGRRTPERAVCSINDTTGTRQVDRPTYTAGLLLRPEGDGPRLGRSDVAAEAGIFRRRVGEVELTAIDVSPAVARRILSSATEIRETDLYGCTPTADIPRLGRFISMRQSGLGEMGRPESASICRYETVDYSRPTLYSSTRLNSVNTFDLFQTLRALPPTTSPEGLGPPDCEEPEAVLLRLWRGGEPVNVWVHYTGDCSPSGVDDGAALRALTSELLRRILVEP